MQLWLHIPVIGLLPSGPVRWVATYHPVRGTCLSDYSRLGWCISTLAVLTFSNYAPPPPHPPPMYVHNLSIQFYYMNRTQRFETIRCLMIPIKHE